MRKRADGNSDDNLSHSMGRGDDGNCLRKGAQNAKRTLRTPKSGRWNLILSIAGCSGCWYS